MSRLIIYAIAAMLVGSADAHESNFGVTNAKILAIAHTPGVLTVIVEGDFQWYSAAPIHVSQLVLVATRDPKVEPAVTHWKPWVATFDDAAKSHRPVSISGLAEEPQKIDGEVKVLYCYDIGVDTR